MISNFFKNTYFLSVFLLFFSFISCAQVQSKKMNQGQLKKSQSILTGAQQTSLYLPFLQNKRIAIVANQTSIIFKEKSIKANAENIYTHLVDSLLSLNINIVKVFSPEHGFRGTADASETVMNSVDTKTQLSIISLFGKNIKPTSEQLQDVDLVVFDLQDVGVRFYTYISTLHYVMEACAESNIPLLVFDRPNPNASYIDGPTLNLKYKSFVGMHPVPLVYGMTIGEFAQMINGEHWLANGLHCELTVIPLKNYSHQSFYSLPIKPSPNLPNDKAINLYPSLGFFEGTPINVGRGTENQFQQYGAPFFPKSIFNYTPIPNVGAKNPKFNGQLCYGVSLKKIPWLKKIDISFLLDAYKKTPKNINFFEPTFILHAGSPLLEQQIKEGKTADEIHDSWQPEINLFKKIRSNYLIYND